MKRNFSKKMMTKPQSSRRLPVLAERLEERQLLSLVIDIHTGSGAKSATVTSVGQVLNLQVWAEVTDSADNPSNDGVEDVFGSFISTLGSSGSVDGNLLAYLGSNFQASGSYGGTVQDLNGDGNLDVGSTSTDPSNSDYFFARAGQIVNSTFNNTQISGNTLDVLLGRISYTVTNLSAGGTTDINFVPRVHESGEIEAVWIENGVSETDTTGSFTAGAPFVVSDGAASPPPVANNDSASVTENGSTDVNVLANDTTTNSLVAGSVTVVTTPTDGTAGVTSNGSILYTPNAGFVGNDSFTYTVQDANGHTSNAATVSITVNPAPAPVANNDSVTLAENGSATIDVLANDSSSVGLNATTVQIATAPAHGTAAVQTNGTVLYTPTHGYSGNDSFTYHVSDVNGTQSNNATVSIHITANPVPTVVNDSATTDFNTPVVVDVLANDSSTVGLNPATVTVVTAAAHGATAVHSDGSITYTPTTGFIGVDTFAYTVADTNGTVSSSATVSVTVSAPIVTPPPAPQLVATANDSGTTALNTATTINVLANDTAGGTADPTSVLIATAPADGTAVANSDGTISYTPHTGFVGTDSFTYTVNNTDGEVSNPATVTVATQLQLSSNVGGIRILTFTPAGGKLTTLSLNRGTAELTFTGAGTVTVVKKKIDSISGAVAIGSIALTGTTLASALAVVSRGAVAIGGISDASPIGKITGTTTTLIGVTTLNGISTLQLLAMADASTITLGAAAPAAVRIAIPTLTGTTLSAAGHTLVMTGANITGSTITAAAAVISLTGALGSSVTLTSTTARNSIAVRGAISGTFQIAGLLTGLSAGSLNGVNLTAGIASAVRIAGPISSSTLVFAPSYAGVGLRGLTVLGDVTDSSISAGVITAEPLGQATAATLGTGTIGAISQLRGHLFSDSTISAHTIGAAALANVDSAGGMDVSLIRALSLTANGVIHRLAARQLQSSQVFSEASGDFDVNIVAG